MIPPLPQGLYLLFELVNSLETSVNYLNSREFTNGLFELGNSLETPFNYLNSRKNEDIQLLLASVVLGIFAISLFVALTNNRSRLGFFSAPQKNAPEKNQKIILNRHERSLKDAAYEGPIDDDFKDPVTLSIMVTPVKLIINGEPSNHAFEKTSIQALIKRGNCRCPLTRGKFSGYVVDHALKAKIENWVKDPTSDPLLVANAGL